jgi:hypothetical protein
MGTDKGEQQQQQQQQPPPHTNPNSYFAFSQTSKVLNL